MSSCLVKVVFFASLKEVVGHSELLISATGLGELWQAMATQIDGEAIQALRHDNVRIAVNQQLIIDAEIQFQAGDEIAFLPPVTGG